MAAHDHSAPKPRFNETTTAILGSLVISLILGTILVGSPFHALGAAYSDYSKAPAGAKVSATPPAAPAPK